MNTKKLIHDLSGDNLLILYIAIVFARILRLRAWLRKQWRRIFEREGGNK